MNMIQCLNCFDILPPVYSKSSNHRMCLCGGTEIKCVDDPNKNWLVEVMLRETCQAQVIKVDNNYLAGYTELHEFTKKSKDTNDLFWQNKSQIVVAPLDTPGVKVVDKWSV